MEAADPKIEITVLWDPETQSVGVRFNNEVIKTWDFAMMILGAAVSLTKFQQDIERAKTLQQQAMQAKHDQMLRSKLRLG